MRIQKKHLLKSALIILAAVFLVTACASRMRHDQEGGISGTGTSINCELESNKTRSECKKNDAGTFIQ